MNDRGFRAVLNDLVRFVADYGEPVNEKERAEWLDQWGDRLLKASGYFKERERAARLESELRDILGWLDFMPTSDAEYAVINKIKKALKA